MLEKGEMFEEVHTLETRRQKKKIVRRSNTCDRTKELERRGVREKPFWKSRTGAFGEKFKKDNIEGPAREVANVEPRGIANGVNVKKRKK